MTPLFHNHTEKKLFDLSFFMDKICKLKRSRQIMNGCSEKIDFADIYFIHDMKEKLVPMGPSVQEEKKTDSCCTLLSFLRKPKKVIKDLRNTIID